MTLARRNRPHCSEKRTPVVNRSQRTNEKPETKNEKRESVLYNRHVVPRTSPEQAKAPGSTHERIRRVAKTLFANRGYEHTSTSAIARQAGTSESQLMKHFGSKAGLLEAIFNEGWNGITEAARTSSQDLNSPVEKLAAISGSVLERLELDPELKLLMLLEGRRIRKEGLMV